MPNILKLILFAFEGVLVGIMVTSVIKTGEINLELIGYTIIFGILALAVGLAVHLYKKRSTY